MNFLSILIVQVLLVACVLYFAKQYIQKLIEWVIKRFTVIPDGFAGKILPALIRVIVLNWYTYLMLLLIWLLLFFTAVGKDIIDAYLSNLNEFSPLQKLLSYLSLFFCIFIMSLSIWILPFFMYSKERIEDILKRHDQFYLGTKILALVAMLPFLLVTNAFLSFSQNLNLNTFEVILLNSASFIIFLILAYVFKLRKPVLSKKVSQLLKLDTISKKIKDIFPNTYFFIVFRILFLVVLLALPFAFFRFPPGKLFYLSYLVAFYIFISSVIVFRLLFYSDETGNKDIKKLVVQMLGDENRKHSRKLYLFLIWPLFAVTFYYYMVPSLETTNALYILLVVFSFFIIYLDFWRNLFHNKNGFWKGVAFIATVLFLVLPFLSNKNQFRIPFIDVANDMESKTSLEAGLKERLEVINQKDSTGNIYIICAMGGGSRAGYITAAVLKAIDEMDMDVWENTICYSTVSGGSVGLYNYIKGRETGKITDSAYLTYLYQKNYNSSGVYGLLIGDAIETLFGPVATIPKSWVSNSTSNMGFYDRNYRIRQEYDYILEEASSDKASDDYFKRTFYPWYQKPSSEPDSFQTYFFRRKGAIPIHLVNTFEINSGRRTVISPFPAKSTGFFPNAMLPLQDTTFDKQIARKEILYREAVNLSELFPIISAASHIGTQKDAQFVDGGYYENYGLATGLDVYYYLRDSLDVDTSRLKMILIKNSNQVPKDSGSQVQFLAPLVGAMNSPFTGHANHLLAETKRVIDSSNLYVITFDAEAKKVPLTRTLTKRHIDSMNTFIKEFSTDTSTTRNKLLNFLKSGAVIIPPGKL